MADFVSLPAGGARQTREHSGGHQIRLVRPHGARGRQIAVTCTCGAAPVETVDGAHDHWAWFNTLAHDETRGPFTRVDPISGRPDGVDPARAREWAVEAGYPVHVTGRVLADYATAHLADGPDGSS